MFVVFCQWHYDYCYYDYYYYHSHYYYNNNNNGIQRRYLRLFTISSQRRELSLTRTLKWPRRNRVQITCNTSSAYHVQHVVLRATWYEGTAQLLSLTELKLHLFKLYFVGWIIKPIIVFVGGDGWGGDGGGDVSVFVLLLLLSSLSSSSSSSVSLLILYIYAWLCDQLTVLHGKSFNMKHQS